MANGGLKMSYSEIESQCSILDRVVGDFNDSRSQMTNAVNILCDGWESMTSEQTRENYRVLADSMDKAVEIVEELKTGIRNYVEDVKALDSAYAGRTVQ